MDCIINLLDDALKPTTEVYATKTSVSYDEVLKASQMKHKPICRYVIYKAEYNDEYYLADENNKIMVIYRAYEKGDKLELYVEERAGKRGVLSGT